MLRAAIISMMLALPACAHALGAGSEYLASVVDDEYQTEMLVDARDGDLIGVISAATRISEITGKTMQTIDIDRLKASLRMQADGDPLAIEYAVRAVHEFARR